MASAPRALRKFSIDRGLLACWFRTFFPSAALFLLTAAFILAKTARDALYFQHDGWQHLPKAYLLITLLATPAAGMTLALMRIPGPRRARIVAIVGLSGLQVVFHKIFVPGSDMMMTLVWVLIPVLFGVALSLMWLLGGLMGAAIARQTSLAMEPQFLYLLSAGLLILWVESQADAGVLGWGMLACVLVWLVLANTLRGARRSPGLIPMSLTDLRPDLPIPDG